MQKCLSCHLFPSFIFDWLIEFCFASNLDDVGQYLGITLGNSPEIKLSTDFCSNFVQIGRASCRERV